MAKNSYRVIDSDLHWIEPDDLFDRYLDPRYQDEAPKVHITPEGRRVRTLGGKVVPPWLNDPAVRRANARLERKNDSNVASARKRHYDPASYVEAMEMEGLDVAVMFRTRASMFISDDGLDPLFAAALARAFNDWAADFCKADSERFKGTAIVSQHDPALAAQEARRAVEQLGMVGVALLPMPVAGRHVHDPEFDVLWAELERLNVPACFHGTSGALSRDYVGARLLGHPAYRALSHASSFSLELMLTAGSLLLGGVLQRFPGLRVAFLEGNCSWAPWWLHRLDDQWEKYGDGDDVRLEAHPSEFFRRQCFISAEPDEAFLPAVLDYLGDDHIVFSTDYPHPDAAFPHAVDEFVAREDVPPTSKQKILWDNCLRLYDIAPTSQSREGSGERSHEQAVPMGGV